MLPIPLQSTHPPLVHKSLVFSILAYAEYILSFALPNIYSSYFFDALFWILVGADFFSLVYWLFVISVLCPACFCLLPTFLLVYNFSYCFEKGSYSHISIIYLSYHTNILSSSFLFMMLFSMAKFKLFRFDHVKLLYDWCQGSTNFSVKGQIISISGFASQMVSVTTLSLESTSSPRG